MGFFVKKIDLRTDAGGSRSKVTCPGECKGSGLVRVYVYDPAKGIKGIGGGHLSTFIDCPTCNGSGSVTQ